MPEDPDLFAYTRTLEGTTLLVICNFFDKTIHLHLPEELDREKKQLISSYTDEAWQMCSGRMKPECI